MSLTMVDKGLLCVVRAVMMVMVLLSTRRRRSHFQASVGAFAFRQSQSESSSSRSKPKVPSIPDKIIHSYQQDGVVKIPSMVPPKWRSRLEDAFVDTRRTPSGQSEFLQQPTDEGTYFTDLEVSKYHDSFREFALHSCCAEIAGKVMQCNETTRFLYDQLFWKETVGVSTPTPWHQDGSYWRVSGTQICTVFVPLDHVPPDEGLYFVKGTQDWPLCKPRHFADGTDYDNYHTGKKTLPDIDALLQKSKGKQRHPYQLLKFGLDPGDVLVFNHRIVHGGPGNYGRALSTRWVGENTKWDPDQGVVPTEHYGRKGSYFGEEHSMDNAHFPVVWRKMKRKVSSSNDDKGTQREHQGI